MLDLFKSLIKYKKFEIKKVDKIESKKKNIVIANIDHKLYKLEHNSADYYRTEKDNEYKKYYFKFTNGCVLNVISYKATLLKLSKRETLKLLMNKEVWTLQEIVKF